MTTPTSTVAPPLPTVTTITTAPQSSPLSSSSFPSSSPPHKSLPDPLHPSGEQVRPPKTHQTGHASHANQSHRPRNKDRERKGKEGPQKRMSVDAPLPPAKRKNWRRQISSSDEGSTSEAPSNASDFVHGSGHIQLEQTGSLVSPRDGGGGGGGGEGRRVDKVARRGDMLHVTPAAYSKVDDGGRVSSHSVSPVHVMDTGRGTVAATGRWVNDSITW